MQEAAEPSDTVIETESIPDAATPEAHSEDLGGYLETATADATPEARSEFAQATLACAEELYMKHTEVMKARVHDFGDDPHRCKKTAGKAQLRENHKRRRYSHVGSIF